jgi:Calx-beta domain
VRVVKAALAATVLLLCLPVSPARATFHFIQIREVFAGTAATPGAQYVELQMYSSGQTFLTGTHVDFFDATGTSVHSEEFSSGVDNGQNQRSILIATGAAETLLNVEADLELTATPIARAGGKICFGSDSLLVDCVSWGSYTGLPTGAGTPFNVTDGIPAGTTLMRDIRRGNPNVLDGPDDTNVSANDFMFDAPAPTNNDAVSGSPPGAVLNFAAAGPSVNENGGPANIGVQRLEGYGAVIDVSYATADGTATADDYTATSGDLSFDGNDTGKAFALQITDDTSEEGDETVLLTLRNATGNTVFGRRPNAILTIVDDEGVPPDTTAPVSRITKPDHRASYRAGRLTVFRGTAQDASGIDLVEVALRMTRTNGSCRWFTGSRFTSAPCNAKRWRDASGGEDWTYRLDDPLPKSVRTAVRHYTLYSRATDVASNIESTFESTRNANRFEIR